MPGARFLSLLLLQMVLSGVSTSLAASDPDQACARCHQKIIDSYKKTPMARASGLAVDGLLPGEFTHAASGVRYRLFLRDGRAWLSYERPDAPPQLSLNGEQELTYFVGSGQRGRTYLFQRNGYWFESPVNWYSKQRVWDMNPKSIDAREMPFTLKVDRGCLHCHSTGVQPPVGGQQSLRVPTFSLWRHRLPVLSWRSCSTLGQWRGSPHSESGKAVAHQARLCMPAMSPGRRDRGQRPGTLSGCFRPGRESFRLCNSLRPLRRIGPQWKSDKPVGSAPAKRVQEKERGPSYLYHLSRSTRLASRRTAGRLFQKPMPYLPWSPSLCRQAPPRSAGLQQLSHAPRKNRRRGPRTSDRPSHPAPSCALFHADAGTHRGLDFSGRRNSKRPRPRAGLFPDGKPWRSGSRASRDGVAATS